MSTPQPSTPAGHKDWTTAPKACPFCCQPRLVALTDWTATSDDEPANVATLTEYQCEGACEGRSFWA